MKRRSKTPSRAAAAFAAFAVGTLALAGAGARAEQPIRFNRDIRPILSDNCFACHGPDKNKRKSGLRLDDPDQPFQPSKSGHVAIVPGKPDESELIKRIFTTDEDDLMPPPEYHKTLTAAQKALLKRWVAEGGKYEPYWAYITPTRPAVPDVSAQLSVLSAQLKKAGANSAITEHWELSTEHLIRSPIDAFIIQKLAEKNIAPSPDAAPETLCRRLFLDLIGLPPTPDDVAAFRQSAIESLVDRLLASPRFGERMAQQWLDLARYSDTVGFHGDQNQNAWAYRDYVIESFNKNKPFDQFTAEQLAGDLLPNPTTEQRIATCFNRLNMMTREGGAQPKEYLAKYTADRIRTVGTAWLGSTFGCAECHDHKFDPIKQKDFYSLGAFFADVKQWGVYSDYGYTPNPDLKGWTNEHPFPPEIIVDSAALHRRMEKLRAQIADATKSAKPDAKAFAAWKQSTLAFFEKNPGGWETPSPEVKVALGASPKKPASKKQARVAARSAVVPPARESKTAAPGSAPEGERTDKPAATQPNNGAGSDAAQPGAQTADEAPDPGFAVNADGRVVFTTKPAATATIDLRPTPGWLAAVKIELLPDARHGDKIVRSLDKPALKPEFALVRKGAKPRALAVRHAQADRHAPRYANGFEIIGVQSSWKIAPKDAGAAHTAVYFLDAPVRIGAGDALRVVLPDNIASAIRVTTSPLAPQDLQHPEFPPDIAASLGAEAAARLYFFRSTAVNAEVYARVKSLEADYLACRDGKTPVMVTERTDKPLTIRVLPRGNWQDESGEICEPETPHFLPKLAGADGRKLTRLDLAKWLCAPDNPLTARVIVNRMWKQFFGNGIAAQVDDLGAQGEPPSHPELLDWLACEFVQPSVPQPSSLNPQPPHAWDIKRMVKLIVTSRTYQQAANLRPELRDIDPNNRLLASQNPRRLEAEIVRDNALAVAGLINLEAGGPPCHPYQPAGYYGGLQFPDREYAADTDAGQYRRGVYMHWQRTFLHPMLANFDAPSREDCIAMRTNANSPQQALTLLNDPEFVECSRAFAAKLLGAPAKTDGERLDLAFEQALARPIKPKEKESLGAFVAQARAEYKAKPEDAAKLLKVGLTPAPENADPIELAAWTSVCRVVLNLHETITRY
jgi:uncharacterized protein DUF1553/uncharacterized protein DUF1549/cytochrome c